MDELAYAAKHVTDRRYKVNFNHLMDGEFGNLQKSFIDMFENMRNFTEELDRQVSEKTKDILKQKKLIEESHLQNKLLIRKNNESIENERRAIAFDLHDTLNTIVLSIIGHARQTKTELQKSHDVNLHITQIDHQDAIAENAQKLYLLSRDLVTNLRPEILDEFGLGEALRELVSKQNKVDQHCSYSYYVSPNFPSLNYEFNIVVYRIVQESLSNVMKHSNATTCEVELFSTTNENGTLINLRIADNGVGFHPGAESGRTGVVGMKERAEGINGNLEFTKTNIGMEVTLEVQIS